MAPDYIPGQWADVVNQGVQTGSGTAVAGSTPGSGGTGFFQQEVGGFLLLESGGGNKFQLE